jgi:hypothetical protein
MLLEMIGDSAQGGLQYAEIWGKWLGGAECQESNAIAIILDNTVAVLMKVSAVE